MASLSASPRKFALENNTASREVKSNPKDRIAVEIGDSKQPDFKPQLKVMRWDNEVNLSVRAEEHPAATTEVDGDVVKYITPDHEVHLYEKPDVSEDGGFEFEWVLPKKPRTNVLTTTIQSKGLDFWYQPALTQAEIDEGANRPENVVGSYAVYHATKGGMNRADGMEYKVGKFCHIYRPEAEDANGTKTWCDLNIDTNTGLLTVTVPQKFLDEAAYPVRVDPTFGYTTQGGSVTGIGNNTAKAYRFSATESGEVDKLSVYCKAISGTRVFKILIWKYSDSTILANSLSTEFSTSNTTVHLEEYTYVTKPVISAEDYHLGGVSNTSFLQFAYDNTGDTNYGTVDTSNNYAVPETLGFTAQNTTLLSIYATYTASGGGGPERDGRLLNIMGVG